MRRKTHQKTQRRRRPFMRAMAVVLALSLTAGLAGCSGTGSAGSASTPTGSDTLRVGVRANISKFGWLNTNTGLYSGLEIDIADEMAARLGYKNVEFVTSTPATKEELLENDEVDCIIACYSITEERAETIAFSAPYYEDHSVAMIQYSSCFLSVRDMVGCTFGTVADTNTNDDLIAKLKSIGFTDGEILSSNADGTYLELDNFNILKMDTYQELSDALDEGRIDAMCADGCIINTYLDDSRRIMNFYIGSQEYGVATLKGSPLTDPIAETIDEMLDDGTIDRLIDKWD